MDSNDYRNRDVIAVKAMQGLLAAEPVMSQITQHEACRIARDSYLVADAMLEQSKVKAQVPKEPIDQPR